MQDQIRLDWLYVQSLYLLDELQMYPDLCPLPGTHWRVTQTQVQSGKGCAERAHCRGHYQRSLGEAR